MADQALALLDNPYHIDGLALPVRATAGIVERPSAGADPVEVMRAADLTRHWARASRRTPSSSSSHASGFQPAGPPGLDQGAAGQP